MRVRVTVMPANSPRDKRRLSRVNQEINKMRKAQVNKRARYKKWSKARAKSANGNERSLNQADCLIDRQIFVHPVDDRVGRFLAEPLRGEVVGEHRGDCLRSH